MRRNGFILGAASLVAALALTLATGSASAEVLASCSKASSTLSVTLASGNSVTIGRTGDNFKITGPGISDTTCGGATVLNINTVSVTGATGAETLTISIADGAFAPGATAEGSGKSEIEFSVNLGSGTDVLVIDGSAATDHLRLGTSGTNLNADDDADVTLTGIEAVTVNGGDDRDFLSGAGKKGTGSVFALPLTINGGDGADDLIGGAANDVENGGPGNDSFKEASASRGGDVFSGGDDIDRILYSPRRVPLNVTLDGVANDGAAGEGDNVMSDVEWVIGGKKDDMIDGGTADVENNFVGGNGADTLRGGAADDVLRGDDGAPGDALDGGAGSDFCFADVGDTVANCEGP